MKLFPALTAASLALMLGAGAALAATPSGTAMHHDGRHLAQARRETTALNLLEAKGYGDFKDFKRDGRDFEATVQQQGKAMTVLVNPEARTIEPTA